MEFQNFDSLRDAIEHLPLGERLEEVTITPDLAGEILKANIRNRPINEVKANILKLVRALRGGYWNPVPVGRICFYRVDHSLADGQCRLSAVLETGLNIVVHIEVIDSVLGMDEGRPRVLAQELHMKGIAKAKEIAAVTRELFRVTDRAEGPPSTAELMAFYETHRAFITECVAKAEYWLTAVLLSKRILNPTALAILRAVAIRQEKAWEAAKVDAFLEDAVTGAGAFEMASLLYRELGERPAEQPKRRKSDMTLAAIDCYLKGKTVKRLQNLKNPKERPRPTQLELAS
jgi:hypothetical protein